MNFKDFARLVNLQESDDFVLAWNAWTVKNKESRPITSQFMRFTKFSTKAAPIGAMSYCYANSLANYKKYGLKMVVGFGIRESEVQQFLKTGELENKSYRGYEHAWNLDKEGRVVDSTWRGSGAAGLCRYYGIVIPDVTAQSFRNDNDVSDYVRDINNHYNAIRNKNYEKSVTKQVNSPTAIRASAGPYDKKLQDKGYFFHHAQHEEGDIIYYSYTSRKNNAGALIFSMNIKTRETRSVSLTTRNFLNRDNPPKYWANLDRFLRGEKSSRLPQTGF